MLSRQDILRALACLLIGVFSTVSVCGQTLTVNDAVIDLISPPLDTEAGCFLPLVEAAIAVGATPIGRPTENSACLRTASGLKRIAAESLIVADGIPYIGARALADAVGGEIHTLAGSVFLEIAPAELRFIEQDLGGDELLLRCSSYAPVSADWVDDVTLRLRMPLCTISESFEARTHASNRIVSVRAVPASSSTLDVLVRLTQPRSVMIEAQEVFDGFSVRLRFGGRELEQASLPLGDGAEFYSWRIPCGEGVAAIEGVWIREWRNTCEAILEPAALAASGEAEEVSDWIVSTSATPVDPTHGLPAGFTMIEGSIAQQACGGTGAICIDLFGRLKFTDLHPVGTVSSGDVALTATATNRPAGSDEIILLQPGYSGSLSASSEQLRVVTVRNDRITSVVDSRYPCHDPSLVTIVASGSARDLLAPVHVGASVCVSMAVEALRTFESIAGGGTLLLREGSSTDASCELSDSAREWATVVVDDWTGGLGVLSIHIPEDDRSLATLVSLLSQLPFHLCNAVLFSHGSLMVRTEEGAIPVVEPAPEAIRFTVIPRTP